MPAKIDESQVRAIAHLARLKLSEAETASFSAQLSRILEYIDQLSQLDTSGVEPTAHPLDVVNVFRADAPGASLSVEQALANAPASDPPFFKVPKVLDQETA